MSHASNCVFVGAWRLCWSSARGTVGTVAHWSLWEPRSTDRDHTAPPQQLVGGSVSVAATAVATDAAGCEGHASQRQSCSWLC